MRNPHFDPPDWPYGVERPGKGHVRACPVCGCEVIFTCFHNGRDCSSIIMADADARRLREESSEYRTHKMYCGFCDREREVASGSRIGHGGFVCAACVEQIPASTAAEGDAPA